MYWRVMSRRRAAAAAARVREMVGADALGYTVASGLPELRARIAAQERIAGLQVGAKIASDKHKISADQQRAGLEMGINVAQDMADRMTPPTPPKPQESE